jgi:hypothetical protein
MRRWFFAALLLLLASVFSLISSLPNANGQFATNTPQAELAATTISGQPAAPTTASGNSGSGFITNTPAATPTPTATLAPSATNTATATPEPIGPYSYPDGINPLTGLPYPNEEVRNRVNMIVKISNYPPVVRPQSGLNMADIVYEYEAEGGVTRFAAIFRSQTPPLVGSIRSGRLMDMELMTMYRANLVYSGTSEPIQRLFLANFPYRLVSPSIGDSEGTQDCEGFVFCRLPREGLAREHTLFGNPEQFWALAEFRQTNTGYLARGFAFSNTPAEGGEAMNDIFVDWYGQTDARWQYDAASGRYLRFTDGVAHYDKGDGQQLWADNVVIIVVPHARRPDLFPEGANYESLEVQLWHHDEGLYQAFVAREGLFYQGYWDRLDRKDGTALSLIFGNNQPILLKPGRTWISVVRGSQDVRYSEDKVDLAATATFIALTPSPTPLNIQEGDGQ